MHLPAPRRRSSRLLLLALLLLSIAVQPACMYANVRVPLDTDVDETELGAKQGRSSMHSVVWLVSWGDAGTAAAADEGGIVTIRHLDSEFLIVLFGLYARRTTIAYGD